MRRVCIARIGLALALVVGLAEVLHADVIHLKNGNQLVVEGWRDAGDAIEFTMGGGVIRISKAEVQKIDGKPSRGDFRMYTSGVSTAAVPTDPKTAATQMGEMLKQGEALFTQTVLTASQKAGAFRRLAEQWRGFSVPEPLQPLHARGDAAIQMAAEAYGAEEDAPDAKERIERAKGELTSVQQEIRKLTEGGQG
jgi:hypothetical protein